MQLERDIISKLNNLTESVDTNTSDTDSTKVVENKKPSNSNKVVLECTECNDMFEYDERVLESIECPLCAENMVPNYVGNVVPDGSEQIADNNLEDDNLDPQGSIYSGRTDESISIDLHEFKIVKVVRGGKLAKVKVRTTKARLSSAQKRALAKMRKKAHTAAASKARKKSMKIRKRLFSEGSTQVGDVTKALIDDLKGQFGFEIVGNPESSVDNGVYTITVVVKDDDNIDVNLGDAEDALSASLNADVEIIGPVYTSDTNSEAELTVLVTPYVSESESISGSVLNEGGDLTLNYDGDDDGDLKKVKSFLSAAKNLGCLDISARPVSDGQVDIDVPSKVDKKAVQGLINRILGGKDFDYKWND